MVDVEIKMFQNLFGLRKVSEKHNCIKCKYSYDSMGDSHVCNLKVDDVTDEECCWRYIKRKGTEDKILMHLNTNWYKWVIIIIMSIGVFINWLYLK